MAVYRYKALKTGGEEFTESGTIVGTDEVDATGKLNAYGLSKVRLERIRGMAVFWKHLTADLR